MKIRRFTACTATLLLFATGCFSDGHVAKNSAASGTDGGTIGTDGGGGPKVPDVTKEATFKAGGSIGQVWVTDANEGDALLLVDKNGTEIDHGTADRLGSFIWRDVTPGDGYTVRHSDGTDVFGTPEFKVLSQTDVPDSSLYDQPLVQGTNYVKMRDGIELAVTVRLPPGKTLADGPFPTVIEDSGYQIAAPGDLLSAAIAAVGSGQGVDTLTDPLLPSTSTAVSSLILPLLGYASIAMQMRGSGCSGGDFQLFDVPTTYDGYDVVEIVAKQSWVKGHKVGLAGISFSGISQFFVAGTKPPHLAAIAPMSVTDDIYIATGFPGGIFNNGFAASWLEERQQNAHPAPEDGAQPYAIELVKQGDQHCIDNQKLRLQTQDINQILADNPFRVPKLVDQRCASTWADKIDVPVFLVGQFHDEQTGGHFPEMISKLDKNPDVWVSMQNGVHADSLGPATISRWAEFLDLFVADRIPSFPATVTALSGELYKAIAAGSSAMAVPPTRFDSFTDPALARTEFRKDPRVRLLFDSGGGGDKGLGALQPLWELGFDAWPVKEAVATSYYLGDAGALTTTAPSGASEVKYTGDPSKRPAQTLTGTGTGDPWAALPAYDWQPVAAGAGVGFSTPPLAEDVLIVGPSSLDLQLKSSKTDTDLQVTLTDVRPDGQEMYVQNGWIRASHRTVDATQATATDPVQLHLLADKKDMPAGAFETVRVQIYPVAYAFRAGSKIRVTVQAPGGDRPRWTFDTIEDGTIENTIQLGTSKLVLPVVPGGKAGGKLPPCPSNRGQPCRAFTPASNGG
ncbi:MAG TPA: CocE/NonD family hydrolase [Polyangiaceae bacterium]|nr:CocE/NonD family hydrolase [Polyangiaceae bacterium]